MEPSRTTRMRNIGSYVSFQQVAIKQYKRCFRYSRRADTRHAAVIDGALALQAGAALDLLADHLRQRAGRAGGLMVGCAEYGDGRDAQRGGDVHGSGIVG